MSGDYYVLLDTQNQTDIWRMRGADFLVSPEWSPDGSRFAMVITNGELEQSDIFIVTEDGHETQLTHLAEMYPSVQEITIENMKWSPDGQAIAFSVHLQDDLHQTDRPILMTVDVTTQLVTDYCIVALRFLWSPNSQQLVLASPTDNQEYSDFTNQEGTPPINSVVVDVVREIAARVAENMEPIGWMIFP